MTALTVQRPSHWPIVVLLVLSCLPLTFGLLRVLQLAGVVDVMPPISDDFWLVTPIVIHIGAAALYAVLGAFQFSAPLRRRWASWHHAAGRVSVAGGILVALSALWLTVNYATMSPGGVLLAAFRAAFASGLLTSLVIGLVAVRRRDFTGHSEWMTRAYALGLGAGTQMIVLMVAEIAMAAPPGDMGRAILMGLAWTINLTLAEWVIRRRRNRPVRRSVWPAS